LETLNGFAACWKPLIVGSHRLVDAGASKPRRQAATSKILPHQRSYVTSWCQLHATACFATYWKPSIGGSGRVKASCRMFLELHVGWFGRTLTRKLATFPPLAGSHRLATSGSGCIKATCRMSLQLHVGWLSRKLTRKLATFSPREAVDAAASKPRRQAAASKILQQSNASSRVEAVALNHCAGSHQVKAVATKQLLV
jgi:hypothetical protein